MLCLDIFSTQSQGTGAALFAIEQVSSNRKRWDEQKIALSIDNCEKFLEDLSEAVKALTSDAYVDPFLFHLADEMIRAIHERPEILLKSTKKAIMELGRRSTSPETLRLLSEIAEMTQQKALSKWKLMKPIF